MFFKKFFATKESGARDCFNRGLSFQKQEKWTRAESAFTQAVALDKGQSHGIYKLDWIHRLAFVRRMAGDDSGAGAAYLDGQARDPALAEWWQGHAHMRNDQANAAQLSLLWSLIDGDGRISSEEQALALLEQCRTVPYLYPDKWWFVAYTMLYRRGWVKAAYLAKHIAAFVSQSSAAFTIARSAERKESIITALYDIGKESEALTYAVQEKNNGTEQNPELLPYLHALCGQMSFAQDIWREINTRSPQAETEQRFGDLICGKRIALVAPAVPIVAQGAEIDSFDLVVRTNFSSHQTISKHADFIGSRTDVSYYNGNFEPDNRSAIRQEMEASPLQFMVLRFQEENVKSIYTPHLPVRTSHMTNPLYKMNAYAVPKIVYDLLRYNPARIKIFNADFFLGDKSHYDGYIDYTIDVITSFFGHDVLRNFLLIKRWRDLGLVETDDRLSGIMELTTEQLLQRISDRVHLQIEHNHHKKKQA